MRNRILDCVIESACVSALQAKYERAGAPEIEDPCTRPCINMPFAQMKNERRTFLEDEIYQALAVEAPRASDACALQDAHSCEQRGYRLKEDGT